MASTVDTRGGVPFQGIDEYDDSIAARFVIDYNHHEIHAGKHFFIGQTYNLETTADVHVLFLETGTDGSLAHFTPYVGVNGEATLRFVEAPTDEVSPANVPYNNRRPSANVSDLTWGTQTSAVTAGTELLKLTLGGVSGQGSFSARLGGKVGGREELILKPGTLYAFEVTSKADNVDVNYIMEWYEHTDKA